MACIRYLVGGRLSTGDIRMPSRDIRDLRDPSKFPDLSRMYRNAMGTMRVPPFHQFVDDVLPLHEVPDYPKNESTATLTRKEYREELQARADQGDKYAQSWLDGNPWDEPSE